MNAQEIAPDCEAHAGGVHVDGDLPLPTPDMSGDDLFRLGMLYSTGQGGAPMDRVSAHMILNLACMKGSIEARAYRKELSEEMDREDLAEAQRAARRWIDQGAVVLAA